MARWLCACWQLEISTGLRRLLFAPFFLRTHTWTRPDTQQHICVYAHVPMLARHFNGLAHDSAGSFRLRDRIVTRAQLSGIVVEVDKRGEKFTKISGHMHSC